MYTLLFFLGLFFFPFNEYEGIPLLGEFKSESGFIFLFAAFATLIVDTFNSKKIVIPYNNILFQFVILFLVWCIITTLLNANTVVSNYFKHTSGINRFVRQYFSLIISSLFFFMLYINVLVKMELKEILFRIRKVFLYSLIIASVYGLFETLISIFGFGFLYPVLSLFDYFPFLEVSIQTGRISSIAYEPPFLAIYLISTAGWMFSYILTSNRSIKFLPAITVLVLTYFSGSRTGLIVVFFQAFIFSIFLYRDNRFKIYIKRFFFGFSIVFSILLALNGEKVIKSITTKLDSLDFRNNLTKSVSNQSRFGMQYAAIEVFKENPIIGVGFGQQAYHNRKHYPGWATRGNYEFKLFYKNKKDKTFPPGYNLYTRLLAETGLVGFILFITLLYFSLKETLSIMRKTQDEGKILAIIVLVTLIGLYINWFQIDTFRMYVAWLSLAILIQLRYKLKVVKNE
ncbi:O-antigen ligase family protein [Flavobacterium poyangense]|uniref:O-antigen ligase family protein n=1 Tax=Flavobacterium poyangense TaxID=2204302 RepID=UPI0014239A14|nr:O-antigen ligase family protein [Flavobacterium sp. JXAS1]